MALTLVQIQAMITNKEDPRQIINEIADYLQANPPSSPGGSSLEAVLTEGNDAGGLAIENLLDPTNDQDAATKKYVDDNAGGGGLLSEPVELTDAQIKALPTTEIEFGTAPGAGKLLKILGAQVITDTTAGAYTNVTVGGALRVSVKNSSQYWSCANGGMDSAFIGHANLSGEAGANVDDLGPITNQPFVVSVSNDDGNYTDGNAANTLKVTVYYVVIDL